MAQSDVDWLSVILTGDDSPIHLLSPLSLQLQFYKCLISDDVRLPQAKITGELPNISLHTSDSQLLRLIALFGSIKFPESAPTDFPESKSAAMVIFLISELN